MKKVATEIAFKSDFKRWHQVMMKPCKKSQET